MELKLAVETNQDRLTLSGMAAGMGSALDFLLKLLRSNILRPFSVLSTSRHCGRL